MNYKKILSIAFMCHRKPERSFFFRGHQFPLCARCTGILVGYIVGILTAVFLPNINTIVPLFLVIPMIIDGSIQYVFKIESTNIRRLITGILGGISIIYIFINIHIATVWLAEKLLKTINFI